MYLAGGQVAVLDVLKSGDDLLSAFPPVACLSILHVCFLLFTWWVNKGLCCNPAKSSVL